MLSCVRQDRLVQAYQCSPISTLALAKFVTVYLRTGESVKELGKQTDSP